VELARQLADARGLSTRGWRRLPGWLYTAVACCAELRALIVQREPYPSFQQGRLGRMHWYYCSDRARAELGYRPRSLRDTLDDTHHWACANGYLRPPDSGRQLRPSQAPRR